MALQPFRNRAFTLVELIVVITILAVLATVGFLAMQGYTKDAKDSVLKTNARSLAKAVEMEASVGSQNPRQFISHSGAYVMSGRVLGTTLSGGTFWTNGTNVSSGPMDFGSLRVNPDKYLADGTRYFLSSLDVPETPLPGRLRSRTFFEMAAVASDATVVEGNFSTAFSGSSGTDIGGIIRNPSAWVGTNVAFVTGDGKISITCNPGENSTSGICVDPYYANVSMLLGFEGASGSIVFTDAKSHSYTRFSNAVISGTSKFGNGGGYFPSDNTSYLRFANSADFNFGNSNWTIETQMLVGTGAVDAGLFWGANWFADGIYKLRIINGVTARLYYTTATVSTTHDFAGFSDVRGSWKHLALVRNGNTINLFINGVPASNPHTTGASNNFSVNTNDFWVWHDWSSNNNMKGWLDEFRMTKGVARYTADFSSSLPIQAFARN